VLLVEEMRGQPPPDEVPYEPRGAALELFYARDPEVLIEGPSGTGKSRAALEKVHLCLLKYPRARAAMARKTRESLTQSAIVTYEQKVLPNPTAVPFNHEAQEYRYANGSILTVCGMDKESKIMSSEYDIIFCQESTELSESEAEILTTRLRNGVMPYQQLIMDCNPADPDHWLNKRCARGQTRRLLSRHEDNPTVTAEYLAKLDALTGYRYKRLRLGLWVAAEGQYFYEWEPDMHICKPFEVPKDWTRWVSIDYGFADPFCALWFAREPAAKRRIYVYREAYATGLRDEQQAAAILKASAGEHVQWYVADPSVFNLRTEQQKPSIAQVYSQRGLRPIVRGINERAIGWQTVRRALAHDDGHGPRLQVMEGRAPNLVRTLPAMVHDPLDSEDLADKVRGVKTDDHCVDSLRYGLLLESLPERHNLRVYGFEVRTDG
jgi:phage terminase large subunit